MSGFASKFTGFLTVPKAFTNLVNASLANLPWGNRSSATVNAPLDRGSVTSPPSIADSYPSEDEDDHLHEPEKLIKRLLKQDPSSRMRFFTSSDFTAHQALLDYIKDLLREAGIPKDKKSAEQRRKLMHISAQISTCSNKFATGTVINVQPPTGQATAGGSFGDVYKVADHNRVLAIKTVRLFTSENEAVRTERVQKLVHEVSIWTHLSHPNILPLLGVTPWSRTTSLATNNQTYSVVSPWMEEGDLRKYMATHGKDMRQVDALRLLLEIASGLHYLHFEGIVHGDLRGANVLINNEGHAVLADFGLTVFVLTHTESNLIGGTAAFMAPELHFPKSMSGKRPWEGEGERAIIEKIGNGERPAPSSTNGILPIPEEIWKVMADCWHSRAQNRPDAEKLLKRLLLCARKYPELGGMATMCTTQARWPLFFNNDPAPENSGIGAWFGRSVGVPGAEYARKR